MDNHLVDATCCGCIPIKIGVVTLAVLGVVAGVLQFGEGVRELGSRSTREDFRSIQRRQISLNDVDAERIFKGLAGVKVGLGLLCILLSLVLLNGLNDGSPSSLRCWVKFKVAILILRVILGVGASIVVVIEGGMHNPRLGEFLPFVIIITAWDAYYVWVVARYAYIMKSEEEEEEEEKHHRHRSQDIGETVEDFTTV